MKTTDIFNPLEKVEQENLFNWAKVMEYKYPELRLMYACPNGGSRNMLEALSLKRQGVKKGVPDIFLPVPKGKYHGLFIELKRRKMGVVSREQKSWLLELSQLDFKAVVCKGTDEAKVVITDYLNMIK